MERYIGLIYSFASGANFGFILRNDIEKFREIFFHINNFEEYGIPQIGDIVEFSEGSNAKGVVANNIKLLDEYSKENVYHKIIHIILDRELLTNKYVKFHQAAFKYIEEICSNVPELKEEAIQKIKSWSKEDVSKYLKFLLDDQRKQLNSIDNELIKYTKNNISPRIQELSEKTQNRLYTTSFEIYRYLKKHILEEVRIEFEDKTPSIYSLEDVREKLTSVQTRGTRAGSRAEWAKICMKYLIDKGDQSSHKEKDEAYYKDISGLLRDCILIYHSSTGQDYLQRPVYDPKCKDHYLWFLGISKFWDTSSTFIHITAHRIQTILRALFNIYLGEKYKTLDQLIKRSLGKNAQKRNIGLQILSSIADKDLGVFFEIIDMMGNIEQQDHNWKCNIDEIIDIFSIPPKRILLESSESFGSSRNSKIFLENYLQLASLIQEEKEIIISELVHLCHLISYIRSVASSIDKFNNISLALNKLIHIHEIIVGIDENTKQKIMQVLHEVKNELELSKLNLQTFQVDLEVVFPEAVYASPRKSVGKEGLPFETRIRILIKNQTSLYAPGVSLRLIDCSEYLAISYMGSTISDLEPLQEVVIEVECYIKNDSGNLRFDYQCTYLGSEKLQDFKATRVLPLSQWNEIPNLYELDAVQDHHKFMFTGRETILRDISRKVNRGGSVMTFGIRRIGKTSILYHLRRELRKLSDIYNIVVVYIDARPWRDEILLNAINNIEREICESIAAACGLGRNTGYENLVRFLNSIGSYLKGSNKKIVLILDEFDMILAHAASLQLPAHQDPWASFLSRLGSPSPDIRRCFSLVIAGHHRLGTDANYMTRYLWCLKDFLPVEVYLFSEEESREYFVNKVSQEFIRQHIDEIKEAVESNDKSLGSLVYSKSVISIIMRLTGNHPYYLSLLCRALIDIMNDKRQWVVTEQDLAEAIFQASMTDNHVMDLWNGSPFAPELFLQPHTLILEYLVKALRSDNDLVSTKYVSVPSKNLQMNSMIYNNTINELSKLYILEKDKDPEMHYRFKIDLIRIIIDRRILNR